MNEEFHDLLVEFTGNKILKGILDPLQGRLHWLLRRFNDPEQMWAEHDEICRAIEAHDPAAAADAALRHVERNKERALHVLSLPEFRSPEFRR